MNQKDVRAYWARMDGNPATRRLLRRALEVTGRPSVPTSTGSPRPVPLGQWAGLVERARTSIREQVVRDTLGRLRVPSGALTVTVIVGGASDEERAGVVSEIVAGVDEGSGSLRHIDAALRPSEAVKALLRGNVVLDEGLGLPGVAEWVMRSGGPVVLSGSEDMWPLSGFIPARVFRLPPANPARESTRQRGPRVKLDAASLLAATVGAWGVPLPVEALRLADGLGGVGRSKTLSRLFTRIRVGKREVLKPISREILQDALRPWRLDGQIERLEAWVRALSAPDNEILIPLIFRIARAGFVRPARRLGLVVADRLTGLPALGRSEALGWAALFRALGEPGLALIALDRSTADSSVPAPMFRCARARALLQMGRTAEVRSLLATAEAARDFEILWILAEAEIDDGAPGRARQLLSAALEQAPGHPGVLLRLGELALVQQDFGAAEVFFTEAVARNPGVSSLWRRWAEALSARGRLGEAIEKLERALAMDPWDPELHALLGDIVLRQGIPRGARDRFRAGLALQPDHAGSLRGLSSVARLTGEWAMVREAAHVALEQSGYPVADEVLAAAEEGEGRVKEAVGQLDRALANQGSRLDLVRRLHANLERLGKLVRTVVNPMTVGQDQPRFGALAAAAASLDEPRQRWLVHREGPVMIALTESAFGELVVNVEMDGRPVPRALVTLERRPTDRAEPDRVDLPTDDRGEVVLPGETDFSVFRASWVRGDVMLTVAVPRGGDAGGTK